MGFGGHIMKNAVITGVTGQDGAYLAKHLLGLGYKVFGSFRRTSSVNDWRLRELGLLDHQNLTLVEHDLTDLSSTISLLETSQPQEIYNLAAQSFVGVSFSQPRTTTEINAIGTLNMLEAMRLVAPSSKFYQASTSEMFGLVQTEVQNEDTPFYPRSPYGVSKLFAHWMTVNYRESYGLFASSGILFNHESPLRGLEFVTRKIANGVAQQQHGNSSSISLGNLDAKRDWGFAGDYVVGMHSMLQIDSPASFVLSSGSTTSVRDFVRLCYRSVGIDVEFQGKAELEVGRNAATGDLLVRVDSRNYRPAEVDVLIGDASKAKNVLGWQPTVLVPELASLMVRSDLERNNANN